MDHSHAAVKIPVETCCQISSSDQAPDSSPAKVPAKTKVSPDTPDFEFTRAPEQGPADSPAEPAGIACRIVDSQAQLCTFRY